LQGLMPGGAGWIVRGQEAEGLGPVAKADPEGGGRVLIAQGLGGALVVVIAEGNQAGRAIGLLAGSVCGLLPVGLPGLPGIFLDGDRREELEQAGAQLWPPQRYHPLGILDQKTPLAERAAVKGGNGIAGIFEGF